MSIYTKTGDRGETSLFGGKRVLKCDELVDVYGSIDELNSWIGLISSKIRIQSSKRFMKLVQSDLFMIGSTLAGWKDGDLSVLNTRVDEMEKWIDQMETVLPRLNNFILPGGSSAATEVHIARSICRRVERQTVALLETPNMIREPVIRYLNRLSDLFFMLARFINKSAKVEETVWSGTRKK